MSFPILPFPYKLTSIMEGKDIILLEGEIAANICGISHISLTMSFPILPFPYKLTSIMVSHISLTMSFPILPFTHILGSIFPKV